MHVRVSSSLEALIVNAEQHRRMQIEYKSNKSKKYDMISYSFIISYDGGVGRAEVLCALPMYAISF